MDPQTVLPGTPPPAPSRAVSLARRYALRLFLGIGIPLLTLAGVLGYTLVQHRSNQSGAAKSGQQTGAQQPAQLRLQQPIDTPRGKRYASVQAIAALDKAQTMQQAHAALQTFLDQYDLTLYTTSVKSSSYVQQHDTFAVLDEQDLDRFRAYGKVFVDEWAKYPLTWVQKSKITHIALIKSLSVDGTARAATPDPVGEAVYYDIGYGSDLYAREVIHHEYDHLVEYNHFGTYARTDLAWMMLNPQDFSYNPEGGIAAYHEENFVNTLHPLTGFVNHYATYGLEEDKAEVYAYLMTGDYYHDLKAWMQTDAKLTQKVRLYRDFMAHESPEMAGSYFDDINP